MRSGAPGDAAPVCLTTSSGWPFSPADEHADGPHSRHARRRCAPGSHHWRSCPEPPPAPRPDSASSVRRDAARRSWANARAISPTRLAQIQALPSPRSWAGVIQEVGEHPVSSDRPRARRCHQLRLSASRPANPSASPSIPRCWQAGFDLMRDSGRQAPMLARATARSTEICMRSRSVRY